jgi:hypothetical protein
VSEGPNKLYRVQRNDFNHQAALTNAHEQGCPLQVLLPLSVLGIHFQKILSRKQDGSPGLPKTMF